MTRLPAFPTGSCSRRSWPRRSARRARPAGRVGLLNLDLDHFKQVNDSLGHDAGDMLLKTFANRLRSVVRSGDTVARLGGDEFAVVLPGLANDQDIDALADSIIERMREPFVYAERILDCRTSIGASIYPVHGTTTEELLKNSDVALYIAKHAARGRMMVFRKEMRSEMRKRASMVEMGRDAIRDDRVVPFYQPKVGLAHRRGGRLRGAAALAQCRRRHPAAGGDRRRVRGSRGRHGDQRPHDRADRRRHAPLARPRYRVRTRRAERGGGRVPPRQFRRTRARGAWTAPVSRLAASSSK